MENLRCYEITNESAQVYNISDTSQIADTFLATSSLLFGLFAVVSNLYIMYVIGRRGKTMVSCTTALQGL